VPRRARPPLSWNIRPKSCEALICCGGGGGFEPIQYNTIQDQRDFNVSYWREMAKASTGAQRIANYVSHALAAASLLLTFWWVGSNGDGFLGGYGWKTVGKRFNLHPLFMVSGMVVLYANALLSWRSYPFPRNVTKVLLKFSVALSFIYSSIIHQPFSSNISTPKLIACVIQH
jgi:hypothetical protein